MIVFCMVNSPGQSHYELQDRKEYASLFPASREQSQVEILYDTAAGLAILTIASMPQTNPA